MENLPFENQVAIVTGGGAGIGRATAILLAQRGAKVVVADVNGESAQAVASEIIAAGGEAHPSTTDMAHEDQIIEMVRQATAKFGSIHILFNNAAITSGDYLRGDVDAISLEIETWDRMMDVNVRGAWLACKHTLPVMISNGGGSIINVSSDTALRGDMGRTAYAASKAAVATLSYYIASQFGRDGVRCNVIRPVALVERPVSVSGETRRAYEQAFVLGRTGTAEDVAKVVAFLASSEASWVTGANIPVNGGFEVGGTLWPSGRDKYEAAKAENL